MSGIRTSGYKTNMQPRSASSGGWAEGPLPKFFMGTPAGPPHRWRAQHKGGWPADPRRSLADLWCSELADAEGSGYRAVQAGRRVGTQFLSFRGGAGGLAEVCTTHQRLEVGFWKS